MRKKVTCLLIAVIVLVTSANITFSSNISNDIVFSDSFEENLHQWELMNEYTRSNTDVYTSDMPYGSTQMVWLADTSPNSAVELKSNHFRVEPEQTYTLTANIAGSSSVKVSLRFFNEEKKQVSYASFSGNKSEKWKCGSVVTESADSAYTAQVWISCDESSAGTASIDNVVVYKGSVYAPDSISDGSNESVPVTDSYFDDNIVFFEHFEDSIDEWSYGNSKHESKVKKDKEQARTGRYSLRVTQDSTGVAPSIKSKMFEVVPDAEYTLTADLYRTHGNPAKVFLKFFDLENKEIKSSYLNATTSMWKSETLVSIAPYNAVSAQILVSGSDMPGEAYADNIKVKKTAEPDDVIKKRVESIYENSLILFLSSPNSLVNGEKTLIDPENDKVIATAINSRTLVPVRFIAENYKSEVNWDEGTKTVELTMTDKKVKIVLDENKIQINDDVIEIDVPAQTIEGRTMLPLRAFVEKVMEKTVFWDDRGLIIITDGDMIDPVADKTAIDQIIQDININFQ